MRACAMHVHVHVCWCTCECVCTCMACSCVYICNFHTSNFLRSPIFLYVYFNTSIDYGCKFAFLNVSVLKWNVHSQCLYIQEAQFILYFLLIFFTFFHIISFERFKVTHLRPSGSKKARSFKLAVCKSHDIFTAETHNFPTGVAPFRWICFVWKREPIVQMFVSFYYTSPYTFIIHTFDSVTYREMHFLMWDIVKTAMRYSKLYKISKEHLHSWDLRFICSSDFSVPYLFILRNNQCWSLKSVIQNTHSFPYIL